MGRTEKILDRLDELYTGYVNNLLKLSKNELIDKAEDISFVKKICDLLHDDAEELPDALAYGLNNGNKALDKFLEHWHNSEQNRYEDEREVMRGIIINCNHEFAREYNTEEDDEDMEM